MLTWVTSPHGPAQEDDDRLLAHHAADRLLEVVDVIGRDAGGAGRGMAGEIDHAAQEPAFLVKRADHTDLRVDGTGRLDDGRVALAGMGEGEPAGHAEPPVERDLSFQPLAHAAEGRRPRLVGLADGRHELLADQGLVLQIDHR